MPLPVGSNIVASDKNMLIYVDGGAGAVAIMCATDFSLEINREEIEISCLSNSDWKEIVMGMKSWSVSFNAVYIKGSTVPLGADQFAQMLIDAQLITVKLSTEITGQKYYEGTVFIPKVSISISAKDKGSYSVSFTGTGPLEIKTVI